MAACDVLDGYAFTPLTQHLPPPHSPKVCVTNRIFSRIGLISPCNICAKYKVHTTHCASPRHWFTYFWDNPSPAPTHILKLLSPVASVSEDFYMYIWLSFLCPTTRRTRLDNKHVIISHSRNNALESNKKAQNSPPQPTFDPLPIHSRYVSQT